MSLILGHVTREPQSLVAWDLWKPPLGVSWKVMSAVTGLHSKIVQDPYDLSTMSDRSK